MVPGPVELPAVAVVVEGAVVGLVGALAAVLEIRDKVRLSRPGGLAVCSG